MSKIFVIDTNVILLDADCIFKFAEHTVVIPITVIEELDRFKKEQDDRGRNARRFSRHIDGLRSAGKIIDGVPLPTGGKLQVVLYDARMELPSMDMAIADNRILAVATWCISVTTNATEVICVSKDVNLRIKADALGLDAADYENSKVDVETLYTGTSTVDIDYSIVETLYKEGKMDLTLAGLAALPPNHCITLRSAGNPKQAVLCRYNAPMNELRRIQQEICVSGLEPRSAEQQYALELLCDPEVELVSLIGLAGSGKTLCAIAAGLHGVLETKLYKKVLLLKPIVSMGNSHQLGFLPGSMEEKLGPWMASFYDNIEFLMGEKKQPLPKDATKGRKRKRAEVAIDKFEDDEKSAGNLTMTQELISRNFIELGSLEHIRGRSLPHQYIIVDEAQNLTPAALKTIISRAGDGTKIVLLGDIAQIDSPYLDASSNGLVYVADKFVNENLSGHLMLFKSERSRLAERAAELL